MTIEPTHYERVEKVFLPNDAEAKETARRLLAAPKPEDAFLDYAEKSYVEATLYTPSKEDMVQSMMGASGMMIALLHHITQRILQQQISKGSFTELIVNQAYGKMVSASCASTDPVVNNAVGHMHYHMAMHRMTGKRVFDVGPGLAEKLRNTELRGLTADDLRLPHPCIYIAVPKEADLKIYNDQSDWHQVIGIYIVEDIDKEARRCWRFLVCGETKPVKVTEGVTDDNDALVYFHIALPEKLPLVETIALNHEEAVQDVVDSKRDNPHSGFEKMLDKWQDIFRWAMNVVLYMSWDGAEKEEKFGNEKAHRLVDQLKGLPKNSKRRHKLEEKLGQVQQLRRVILGRSVVFNRGGWTLTVRVLVTGHWRNQPYGPGHSLRRLQWIEPYWRGPEENTCVESCPRKGPLDGVEGTTAEVAPSAQEQGTGGTEDDAGNRESNHDVG